MSYAQVRKKLPLKSYVLRIMLVTILVFGTVNPSKYTLTTWLLVSPAPLSVRVFFGFALFVIWIVVLRFSWQGLRALGFSIVIAIGLLILLVDVQFDLFGRLSSFSLKLLILSLVVAVISLGIVGSYLVRWLAGQSPVVKNPP